MPLGSSRPDRRSSLPYAMRDRFGKTGIVWEIDAGRKATIATSLLRAILMEGGSFRPEELVGRGTVRWNDGIAVDRRGDMGKDL